MPSIPQLQSDINKLQAEKRELQKRVKELEDRGQKVVYRDGPERVVTKRVEVPVEKIVIKRVEVPVEKIVIKSIRVKGPVQYVDNPEHIKQIEKLRGMLNVGH